MLPCSLCYNLTLPLQYRSRNQDSSVQATFFQSSIAQFWRASANCSLIFLMLTTSSLSYSPFYLLQPVWLFSSDICHKQGIFAQRNTAQCIFSFFSWLFFVNLQNGCVWKKIPVYCRLLKYLKPARLAPTTTVLSSKSRKKIFLPHSGAWLELQQIVLTMSEGFEWGGT